MSAKKERQKKKDSQKYFVLSFWLSFVYCEDKKFPEKDDCDFMKSELIDRVSEFYPSAICLDDEQDGEGISMRIGIKHDPNTVLVLDGIHPWELLEITPFEKIYPTQNPATLFREKQ